MAQRIDLHTHTTASDGVLDPRALVRAARARGIRVLGITDHDTVAGLGEAIEEAERVGIELVPGVELSAEDSEGEVHILGYFVDWQQQAFRRFLDWMHKMRIARAQEMVRRLRELGVPLSWEEVLRQANGAIGRPHVARALVAAGHVRSWEEAFCRYLGRGAPAYVPSAHLTPEGAVEAIRAAGGIPVLAHPQRTGTPERVAHLVERGLRGIEVYYPDHTPGDVRRFLELARRYGLVATGGSDYHGPGTSSKAPLGSQYVPPDSVKRLRALRET